jgi:FtsZ-binding cell division protein ZapB
VSEGRQQALEGASRFVELKGRVDRAAKLISELRETNYALTTELAALHRKLESLESNRKGDTPLPPAPPPSPQAATSSSSSSAGAGVHEELQTLRDERKIIRAKVQSLLERIEKLEL